MALQQPRATVAHHLFVKYRAWSAQIRDLWRSVEEACERRHPWAPTVRLLFQDERATPAVLAFLRETKVGRIVALAPPEEEESGELEEVVLRPGEEEGQDEEEEEGGPGPP